MLIYAKDALCLTQIKLTKTHNVMINNTLNNRDMFYGFNLFIYQYSVKQQLIMSSVKSVHHSEEEAVTSIYADIRNINKAGLASVMMITLF